MTDPDVLIVRRLIEAGDDFVSGNKLGTELALSRVSVWSHMERLRKQGFGFEAVRSRGYRLAKVPERLNPILVKAHCSLRSMPRIEFREEIDSTNSEAERLLASGVLTPLVVLSRSQNHGRGRLGRTWSSPDTGNLYILSSSSNLVVETTTAGTAVSAIDLSILNADNMSGLAYAPGSNNPFERSLYIIAR